MTKLIAKEDMDYFNAQAHIVLVVYTIFKLVKGTNILIN